MRVTPTDAIGLWKDWRRGSESNRRIKVLQTSPLPLGYRAILNIVPPGRAETGSSQLRLSDHCGSIHRRQGSYLERETGLEPATLALARRCSTTELLPHYVLRQYIGRFDTGSTHEALFLGPEIGLNSR